MVSKMLNVRMKIRKFHEMRAAPTLSKKESLVSQSAPGKIMKVITKTMTSEVRNCQATKKEFFIMIRKATSGFTLGAAFFYSTAVKWLDKFDLLILLLPSRESLSFSAPSLTPLILL